MRIKPPIIVDCTVLSNFAHLQRLDILYQLYPKDIIVPTNVIAEIIIRPTLEPHIKAGIANKWIEEYSLDYTKNEKELKEYANLRRKFGDGECAVMSIAKTWDCTVATDDMTAAVKYCQSNNIPLIGTLGILYKGYEQKVITNIDAENLLQTLITNKYYKSPVSDFKSVIDSFERNIGKKLY